MTVKLIDPRTGGELLLGEDGGYPVVNDIPRVCEPDNYTQNFGLQWNKFAGTQIDRDRRDPGPSEQRFFLETGWNPADLEGLDILEVGSGAGRFSRVILERTKANLWSVDYSSAVDANRANNASIAPERLRLFQASIYEMPFADGSFDKVVCLGVLQHTPDFEASVKALVSKARPGGEIIVDFYPIKGFWTKISAKYMLRPWTKRMSHDRLLGLIDRNADRLIRASELLDRAGLHVLTRFLPVCDIRATIPATNPDERREWVVLDTFDMFSPEYDNPQRIGDVAAMFRRSGAEVTFADYVAVGPAAKAAVVRAVKI